MRLLAPLALATVVLTSTWRVSADAPESEPPRYAEPRATATLQTPQPLWVNQMAELEVTLSRDNAEPTKAPPDFGEVRVPNAIALRTDYAPPPEVVTRDGVSVLLQKRRYLIFPQGVGQIEVPPIEVSWVSPDGSRVRVETELLSFGAKFPTAAGSSPYVVASALSLREELDGDLDRLRVGDSFTRTVVIEATGTDAMMIPAIDVGAPSHLAAYPSQADVETTVFRGRYDARRADATTFVAESFGWTSLPEASVRWLNPQTGKWHTETLPGRSLRVRINPSLGWTAFGSTESNTRRIGALVVVVLAAWLLYLWWRRRRRVGKPSRTPTGPSERTLFLRLLKQARRNDPLGTLNAAYKWMGARDDPPPTLNALCERTPEAHTEADALQRALFDGQAETRPWTGRAFASAMRDLRRTHADEGSGQALPPLNPSEEPE